MTPVISNSRTTYCYEDVIVGAMRFFTAEKWRYTTQTARMVAFRGKPRMPWYVVLFVTAGILAFVVPGLVLYMLHVRKNYQFTNIVVTTTPVRGGTEVLIQYPPQAEPLARRFVGALPPLEPLPPSASQAGPRSALELTLAETGRA
jgi:hypothetical protein